ncbi:sulfur reduction protein DsrE [Methanosarcina sp. KYL-1]|uniref:DsrE/DsrF/TusD sulfur relay family protein n=1 Tax=Methanosarcina sp. KYL-1 TaxID=2602068 RepID=UPI002101AD3C|nr:DsrE family protein [Methanosarcina sp. KYL-1]MCQ1534441.1 sulfur reduction protein DsrE [Methanosarcina sp. KYL-1]
MKTLTIVLTDGPYISEYAEIACKLADEALKRYQVNIFLYLDAVHIPKKGQNPSFFINAGELFTALAERGAVIRACARCAAARGYIAEEETASRSNCRDYIPGIKISSLYELSEMLSKSDRVISLSR